MIDMPHMLEMFLLDMMLLQVFGLLLQVLNMLLHVMEILEFLLNRAWRGFKSVGQCLSRFYRLWRFFMVSLTHS